MNSTRPIALITGASAGLGAVFARKLAASGYDLILVARRRAPMEALARELSCRVELIVADLAVEEQLLPLEDRLREGGIAMLVNNAGFGTRGRFWETGFEAQLRMHRLHVIATMRLCRAALEAMVPARRGSIVNVASVAAFGRTPGNTSYCATKSWMTAFTEGLHMELASVDSPVRVLALCPGYTYTEFHDVMGSDRGTVPKSWWMSAEDVVDDCFRAPAAGKVQVVPGARYRWLVRAIKHIPDSWRIWGSIRYGRRMKRT